MRKVVISGTIFLFLLATMFGSWLVRTPSDEPGVWKLIPFREAFGLGLRSYLFSLPAAALCLLFRHRLWPEPLSLSTGLCNLVWLPLLGFLLGRVNLLTQP